MNRTWRERNAEARERGHFTDADIRAWADPTACPVGEIVTRVCGDTTVAKLGYAVREYQLVDQKYAVEIGGVSLLQNHIFTAITRNRFGDLDSLLDWIEDAALQVKRELHGH